MPRLAGQPAEHLGIATVLSDEDIESLAAYLTTQ
ncbi:c-type cytochrome [Marinobacter litoralis]